MDGLAVRVTGDSAYLLDMELMYSYRATATTTVCTTHAKRTDGQTTHSHQPVQSPRFIRSFCFVVSSAVVP